jgi:hypothetical protein
MASSGLAGKMIFHRAAAEEWRLMKKVANKERSQAIKNWCWAAAAFYRRCMRPGEMRNLKINFIRPSFFVHFKLDLCAKQFSGVCENARRAKT